MVLEVIKIIKCRREMLKSALRVFVKKFKMETLSWKLCIQHIKTTKSNFIYLNFINHFRFWILNKCPGHLLAWPYVKYLPSKYSTKCQLYMFRERLILIHCQCKSFYTLNQSETTICMNFKVDVIKVNFFINLMVIMICSV